MKVTAILDGLKSKNPNFEHAMIDKSSDNLILKDGTVVSYYGDENDGPNDCFNYADWSSLEDTGFFDDDSVKAETVKIDVCDDYGFRLNGYFVNCYSVQNGYYTDELTISVDNDEKNIHFKVDCISCE